MEITSKIVSTEQKFRVSIVYLGNPFVYSVQTICNDQSEFKTEIVKIHRLFYSGEDCGIHLRTSEKIKIRRIIESHINNLINEHNSELYPTSNV